MPKNQNTLGADRDPYFAQTLQTLKGQTAQATSQLAATSTQVGSHANQLASISNQLSIINSRLANLENLASK